MFNKRFFKNIISSLIFSKNKINSSCKNGYTNNYRIKVNSTEELSFYIREHIYKEGVFCDLNFLDVSSIEDMSFLFSMSHFRGDISQWDVSRVKNMSNMFHHCDFNGDLSKWDVRQVVFMDSMFEESRFNQDLSKWDIQSAVNLDKMFFNSDFNNRIFDLGKSVRDMRYMFANTRYSRYLGDWDVSRVKDMTGLFMGSFFNGDISRWNVEQVEYFDNMFADSNFKGDISAWNPLSAKSMTFMFTNRTNKNIIQKWNLDKVDDTGMFYSKAMYDDYEKNAAAIYNAIPIFENEFPNDILRFGVPLKMNGKFYIALVANSPFNEKKWYVRLREVSEEIYELQKEINSRLGRE